MSSALLFPSEKLLSTEKCNIDQKYFFGSLSTIETEKNDDSLTREEVEKHMQLLELEPLLVEYLVKHGAISSSDASELLEHSQSEKSQAKHLLNLLDFEDHYSDISNGCYQNPKLLLFVNALRNTGQHELASRLDCGRKINPAPPTPLLLGHDGDLDSSAEIG